jgi:hypothetical protein
MRRGIMKSSAPVAVALAAGYLLGRTRKMRWALVLGAAAASGQLGGLKGQLLEQGTKALQSSPELAKIGESGGRLLDAGKAAAMAAVSSRVDSLSGTLQDRTESLAGAAGGKVPGVPGGEKGGPAREGRGPQDEEPEDEDRAGGDEADEDAVEEDEYDEDEDEEDEGDEDEGESDEYDEDEEEPEDEEPVAEEPKRAARARSSSQGPAVRKTGRRS